MQIMLILIKQIILKSEKSIKTKLGRDDMLLDHF